MNTHVPLDSVAVSVVEPRDAVTVEPVGAVTVRRGMRHPMSAGASGSLPPVWCVEACAVGVILVGRFLTYAILVVSSTFQSELI